jgi:hypothetical protein
MKAKFTAELFDSICKAIATSPRGLQAICKKHDISSVQFYEWIKNDAELANKYAHAREQQADLLADEILEIADNIENDNKGINGSNAVQRDRLRIDSRKFLAAKLKPKKYSERIDITSDGEAIKPIDLSSIVSNFVNKDAGDGKAD